MAGPKSLAALVCVGVLVNVAPAAAQFGTIFGDSPRPPANVPGRQPYPPPDYRGAPPPPADSRAAAPPQGAIQSQPLPPPAGTEPSQQGAVQRPGQPPPLPGLPPGQRQPRGTPQPANTSPQPGDEVITAMPAEKIPNPNAVFSGLDKITGRIITFDVAINETVQFGALQVTPRVCYTRPPTETPNTDGFVDVDEITLKGETKRIFTGWMFAASPGLHGVEHPIYDVWLVDCKKDSPSVAGATPSNTAAATPPQAASPPPPVAPTPAPPAAPARPAAPSQTGNPGAPTQRR
jgi:hypothetical protein